MAKTQKVNIDLLKRLRARFLRMRDPKHFDMADVVQRTGCGTAMCIAGHTLDLNGYKVRWDGNVAIWYSPEGELIGDRWDAMDEAARLLGMGYQESQSCNSGLFMQFKLKTPRQAATYIAQIIERKSRSQGL